MTLPGPHKKSKNPGPARAPGPWAHGPMAHGPMTPGTMGPGPMGPGPIYLGPWALYMGVSGPILLHAYFSVQGKSEVNLFNSAAQTPMIKYLLFLADLLMH